MKQSELAIRLNVKQNTISNWETGRTEPDYASLQKLSKIFGASIDAIVGNDLSKSKDSGIVSIPVLGDVAAGIPMMAVENIIDYEEVPQEMANGCELFGLRVKGSSMEPRIKPGDVVIVRKQDDADTGDTAVVLVNGDSATVKKIKKEKDGLSLVPNNPAYEIQYFSAADVASLPVRIIGKVIELRGKF